MYKNNFMWQLLKFIIIVSEIFTIIFIKTYNDNYYFNSFCIWFVPFLIREKFYKNYKINKIILHETVHRLLL